MSLELDLGRLENHSIQSLLKFKKNPTLLKNNFFLIFLIEIVQELEIHWNLELFEKFEKPIEKWWENIQK